ncbi:MAG: TIGR02147 family protein [Pseudobacteriovorax sp.]|nr:TIGR02147 family protein [Pseudobacteriovorax sp.]
MINIFRYLDYRKYLKQVIHKDESTRGFQGRLASAAGCQRSYLSQVLNGSQNLTLEHAMGIADFLDLSDLEVDYFILLIQYQKISQPELKTKIKGKLNQTRARAENLKDRLSDRDILSIEAEQMYFSNWYWSAIHLLLGIDGISKPSDIARYLDLPEELVLETLRGLAAIDLVKYLGGQRWQPNPNHIHLAKDSPLIKQHHNNWRLKSLDGQSQHPDGFQFSAAITIGKNDLAILKGMILRFIDEIGSLVDPSPAEELVNFNIDLLPLDKTFQS